MALFRRGIRTWGNVSKELANTLTMILNQDQGKTGLSQFLKKCNVSDVPKTLLWMYKEQPYSVVRTVEKTIMERMGEMSAEDLGLIFSVVKDRGTGGLYQTAENRTIQLLPELSGTEIFTLLRVFSGIRYDSPSLFQAFEHSLLSQGNSLPIREKVACLLSFHLSKYSAMRLLSLWYPSIFSDFSSLDRSEISNLLMAFSGNAEKHRDFYWGLEGLILKQIPGMRLDDLVNLTFAYSHVPEQFKRKIEVTIEFELLIRAKTDVFSMTQIAKICKSFTKRLGNLFPVLEKQIETQVFLCEEDDLAMLMYHMGINKLGKEQLWLLLTEKLINVSLPAKPRSLSLAAYGALYRDSSSPEFYASIASSLAGKLISIKDAEKLIPVYTKYVNSAVLAVCSEVLLRDFQDLPKMRVLTLINFYIEAKLVSPELQDLLRKLKQKPETLDMRKQSNKSIRNE